MRVRDRDVPDSLASLQLPKPPLASVRERIKNGVCPNPPFIHSAISVIPKSPRNCWRKGP